VAASDNEAEAGGRSVPSALLRGTLGRCPACGSGRLFRGFAQGFLGVRDRCEACGEDLHHQRADDAPAYFTMVVVGHVVVGLALWAEIAYAPPLYLHLALWAPLALAMSLVMLRPIKGALIGLQWALLMHGFDPRGDRDAERERAWTAKGDAA